MMPGALGKPIPAAHGRIFLSESRETRLAAALKLVLAIFADSIYLDNNPSEVPATGVGDG
jgi:hypothetical protein